MVLILDQVIVIVLVEIIHKIKLNILKKLRKNLILILKASYYLHRSYHKKNNRKKITEV